MPALRMTGQLWRGGNEGSITLWGESVDEIVYP
jgi:hypothetical protein